ncbi:MAG TPA: hypothetical protein VM261_35340 [Kofleriaceae bacterium]|nr:hypothetical protein [Kofleriaceae bacterium]
MWIFLVIGLVAAGIFFKLQARKKMEQYIAGGSSKPKPLRNNAVADLTKAAMSLLLVKVASLDRTGDAVMADASIWHWEDENLMMNDGVPINADDIPPAAVDFASASARKHTGAPGTGPSTGPITEERVTAWLEEGVSKAIARFVLDGVARSQKRFAIMTRTSPPLTAAEIAEMKRENERERAEMDKLLGDAKDTSNLPRATLKKS